MLKTSVKITTCRIALRFWPKQLGRAIGLENLASLLHNRFRLQGSISDLDEALALARISLQLRPQGHPLRSISLSTLALYLIDRFEQLETLSDLDEALSLERNVLDLRPQGHPLRAFSLRLIATYLRLRFTHVGISSDLDEALALERQALELDPREFPQQAISLGNLADTLYDRFTEFNTLSDLDEAISLGRSALELYQEEDSGRASPLSRIAFYLHTRFMQLGTLSDLDEALVLQRTLLELRPRGHPDRANSLSIITNHLHDRFTQLGSLSDLEEALTLERDALELRPQGHPDRAVSLGNIASYLNVRFKQLGGLSDLEEAIALQRSALELRPQGDPFRAVSLGSIAIYLHSRFTQLGMMSDLDEALALQRSALELRPQGHPHRAISLTSIASCLRARFNQLGTLSDLDEAISLERSALQLRPPGHPHRALSLGNLAIHLHDRFFQLGTLPDLEEALALERQAFELRQKGHPEYTISLGNIAKHLHARFTQLGALSDLHEALALERSALELRPHGHPHRDASLSSIAKYLHAHFTRQGKLSDLDEALALERSALELRPHGHPHRATSLSNIALYSHAHFDQLGSQNDLNEALVLERQALELRPQGHPLRASSLCNLASYLHARYKHSVKHDITDLHDSFHLYSQLSHVSQAVSFADLKCAKQWIKAAEECEHSTTVLAYRTFLSLSVQHLATLPSLPQHLALLKQLTTSTAVDAFSVCVRKGHLADAVELLEQGRGVFWSQLIRLRSPLDDVIGSGDAGKKLADEFTRLSTSLRHVLDARQLNAESQHDRACRLNIQLRDIVTEIRKLPGLSRFLLPPLFSDLQIAASDGPAVVVNASQYSCDALIVLPDKDPVHVVLPITRPEVFKLSRDLRSLTLGSRFDDLTREFLMFLRQLWDSVVFPIVETLQKLCPHGSHIWWCPTAEFTLHPLHAAGSFRKGQPMFSDLYISSYTPTLAALIRARQKRPLSSSMGSHRFLIVGQAQAAGQCELPSVNTEVSSISHCIGSISTVIRVQDQDATTTKVVEELEKCEFVHFACHGIPDQRQPFKSGFALGDELLNVEKIMQYDLQHARFAYLSACHTTVGDEESPDEVIHLAAAMQFAGFRSVIGTMWAVADAHTDEITSRFYNNMIDESGHLDHTRAALALHKTMRSFRWGEVPWDQRILYIHIGA